VCPAFFSSSFSLTFLSLSAMVFAIKSFHCNCIQPPLSCLSPLTQEQLFWSFHQKFQDHSEWYFTNCKTGIHHRKKHVYPHDANLREVSWECNRWKSPMGARPAEASLAPKPLRPILGCRSTDMCLSCIFPQGTVQGSGLYPLPPLRDRFVPPPHTSNPYTTAPTGRVRTLKYFL